MNTRFRPVQAVALALCFAVLALATSAAANGLSPVIAPELELLSGVLAQTTWIERRGPAQGGSEYYRALKEFFAPYRGHEAVAIAQELTSLGFTYDAPVGFIAHLGPLPELNLRHEYSDYIVRRSRDRQRLERFRLALRDLAAESGFMEWFASWTPEFDSWIAALSMDGEMVVAWLEEFFGRESEAFHLILAPAMFPGGGYGATVTTHEGQRISFQVVRERGNSSDRPEFPNGKELEYLSLHEWGHSYVNPALEAHSLEVARLKRLYLPVAKTMSNQAYNNVHVFMNEQVLRAVTTIAMEELYGPEDYDRFLALEEHFGFYLTADVVAILRAYQADRATYPTFGDFVPELLRQMSSLKAKSPLEWDRPYIPLSVAVVLLGGLPLAWGLWLRRRK